MKYIGRPVFFDLLNTLNKMLRMLYVSKKVFFNLVFSVFCVIFDFQTQQKHIIHL